MEMKTESDDDCVQFIGEVINRPNSNAEDELMGDNFKWIELIDLTSDNEDDQGAEEAAVPNTLEVGESTRKTSISTAIKDERAQENSHSDTQIHLASTSEPTFSKPQQSSSGKGIQKRKRKKRRKIVINCSRRKVPPKKTKQVENFPISITSGQAETSSNAPVDQRPRYKRAPKSLPKKRVSSTRSIVDSDLEESFEFIRDYFQNIKPQSARINKSLSNKKDNLTPGKAKSKKVALISRLHTDFDPVDFDIQNM